MDRMDAINETRTAVTTLFSNQEYVVTIQRVSRSYAESELQKQQLRKSNVDVFICVVTVSVFQISECSLSAFHLLHFSLSTSQPLDAISAFAILSFCSSPCQYLRR